MAFSQNTFYFCHFWCQDGSRPNLIGSHERAFHKDSESGLNSKMVIGTQMTFTQNTAETVWHEEKSVVYESDNKQQ